MTPAVTDSWRPVLSFFSLPLLQPAPPWRNDLRGGRSKPSSARCGRCAATPRFCPQRRTWTTWTRSWKPNGCRDNQRQATTSSRRGEGVPESSPPSSMRTPETKCQCWKNASTCPAKRVRSPAWARSCWSPPPPAKTRSWPPSKRSSTWPGRHHPCPRRPHHPSHLHHPRPHRRPHLCPRPPEEAGRGNTNHSLPLSPSSRSPRSSPFPRKRRSRPKGRGNPEGVRVMSFPRVGLGIWTWGWGNWGIGSAVSRDGGRIPRCRDTLALLSRSWAGRIGPHGGADPSALGKAKQGGRFHKKLVCALQQFPTEQHLSMARSLTGEPAEDPSRRRKPVVLSDSHRPPASEVRPWCMAFAGQENGKGNTLQ